MCMTVLGAGDDHHSPRARAAQITSFMRGTITAHPLHGLTAESVVPMSKTMIAVSATRPYGGALD